MWLLHSVNSSSLSSPSPEHIQYTVYGLSWVVYLDQIEEVFLGVLPFFKFGDVFKAPVREF